MCKAKGFHLHLIPQTHQKRNGTAIINLSLFALKESPPVRGGGSPGRGSDVLVGATLPAKKGQVYFGRFLSAETSRSSGDPPSSVIGKSAALSEVCGKFWTCRAHRGFAIINPQVERMGICGVVDPSRFCRILPKFRRISLKITVHITQNRPLPLLGSGLKPYE